VWGSVEFLALTEGFFVAANRDCHQSTIVPRTDRIHRARPCIYLYSLYIIHIELSSKIGEMSANLLIFALSLCLLQSGIVEGLSLTFGNLTLFNVNFKTPAILGRSVALDSNLRIENDVDPNIQEDSHLNTVS